MKLFTFCSLLVLYNAEAFTEPLSVMYKIQSFPGAREVLGAMVDDFELLPDLDKILVIGDTTNEWKLTKFGFNVTDRTVARPFSEVNKQYAPPAGYDTPQQLLAAMQGLQNQNPGIARVINLMQTLGTPTTIQGRPIYAIKISDNVGADEDEPNLLVVAAHHCRELITPQLVLDQARRLVQGYGSDAAITRIVNENQVYMIWDQNPDGANYVWTVNDMWRKNRRNNGNNFGVDLNRNYPVGWSLPCSGSPTTSSCTYRGPSAQSESETRAMVAFHRDRHFVKVMDFHSYAREVRQNYGTCANLPSQIDSFFATIAQNVAAGMNYRAARSCCLGGNIHAAYHNEGALAFLTETGTAFQPSANVMRAELVRVWPGLLRFLEVPISLSGHVYNRNTDQPIASTFSVPALNFNLNEVAAYTTIPFGRYHIWLPSGSWEIVITSANGVFRDTVNVTQGTVRDFYV